MACLAINLFVQAFECKLSVLIVVKPGLFPVALVVTVRALLAVCAVMNVIQRVAAVAGRRCFRVTLVDMTGVTGGMPVFTLQSEFSFVVVKPELRP